MRDAEKTLKLVLEITINKIVSKRSEKEMEKLKEIEKHPLFYLVQYQENYKDNILPYQIDTLNE